MNTEHVREEPDENGCICPQDFTRPDCPTCRHEPSVSQSVASRHPTDPPRGDAIREPYGWRILSCSDVRHSWVEIEPPREPVAEWTPAMAHRIADAIRSVAQYTSDVTVKHFVERGD